MEKVAGFLEVLVEGKASAIVMKVPNVKPDSRGTVRIVLSPRHARHLSSLLEMSAEEADQNRKRGPT
jgi:hypothetical protein